MPITAKTARLYTVEEVSSVTRLHTNTIYKRIKQGIIKSTPLPKSILIEHDDLVKFLYEELNLPETIIEFRLKSENGLKNG